MAVPAAVLSVLVQANTGGATRGLLRFNQQLDASNTKAGQATRALATFAKVGVIGTGIGLGYAVSKAADFEEQLDSLGSVTKASGREMEQFRKQAMKAGADTKFSALDAAEAQTELAKGGLRVRQIMRGGLRSALALAAAGEMELGEAAQTTANALNLFGLRGRDSMKVADALAKAANATTADVTDFAMALRQSGGVAKTAGLSFSETVLALEALASAGTKNSDAGTSLKTALIQLIKPTAKQQELSKKLNLEFLDAEGNFKNLADVSTMLRDRLGGMTAAQRTATLATLAGTDGVRTLTALYDAGPKKLDKWKKGLNESGTAAEVAARKQSNLKGRLENLQGSIETIAIAVGMKLIPQLTKYAEQLTDILNNTKLSGSEKVGQVAQLLAEAIGKGIAAAGTAAAKAAPHVAWAFVKAFMEADAWGKLAIGGAGAFLLKKLGVGSGIGKLLGRGGGGGLTGGVLKSAKPIPVFVTNPGGLGGGKPGGAPTPVGTPPPSSKLKKVGGKIVRAIPGLGGVVIAIEVANAAGVKLPNKNLPTRGPDAMERRSRTPSGQGGRMLVPGGPVRTPGSTSNGRPDEARTATSLAKAKDALAAAARLRKTVTSVNEDIQRLRAMSGRSLGDLSDSAVKNFRRIRETIGLNTKEGRQAADRNFKAISSAVAASMNKGKTSTNAGMAVIEKQLKVHSRQGKEGLSRNFTQAIDAVKGQMRRGGRVTAEGLSVIKSLMVSELKAYGISGKEALRIVKQGGSRDDNFRLAGHQRGGPINVGKPFGDTVPAMLERGEYVMNRNAVKKVGRKTLDQINFAAAPRFQKGGFAGMISAANQVDQAQFPYSWGGGHQATPAPFGPFDCSGAVSYVLQKGGVKIPTMVSGSMMGIGKPGAGQVTVYANPGHVFMSILGKFFGTSGSNPGGGAGWFPDPGDSYKSGFTKRHFGTDDLSGVMGGLNPIKRVEVGGPDSLLKSTVQGALDLSRAGANKKLSSLIEPIGAGQTGDPGPVGNWKGGSTRAFAQRLASKVGLSLGSGYRTPEYNASVGGAPNSMHTHGTVANPGAWDVPVNAYGPDASKGDRLAALARAARLAEVIWRAPDHYDHVHLGFFQKGGFLDQLLAKGGAVGGRWGKDIQAKELPSFYKSVWNQAKKLGKFKGRAPDLIRGKLLGKGWGEYNPGTDAIHLAKPQLRALGDVANPSHGYAMQLLLHEIAHSQQRAGLSKMEREGGADLWAGWAGPQIFSKLGIGPTSTQQYGYPGWANRLHKEVDPLWWQTRQFGTGIDRGFTAGAAGAAPGSAINTAAEALRAAGFKGLTLIRMIAEAGGESGWNFRAVGDGGASKGMLQIHTGWNPWAAGLDLFDPFVNAKAAKRIYDSQGVGAWHAEHEPHMARAKAAYLATKGDGGGGGGGRGGGGGGVGDKIKKLAYVGDSLGVGTLGAGLKGKLGKIKLASRAAKSKVPTWGASALKGMIDKGTGAAMLDMGSNGTLGDLQSAINSVEGALGNRPLMMATLDPQVADAGKKNAAIRENANVVVPWGNIANKFSSDRVHPTGAGYSKRAAMIAAAAKGISGKGGEAGLTEREKKQLKTPLKGSLKSVLTKTLKVLRSNKPAKFRGTRLKQLERRIGGVEVGLPKGMRKQIASLRASIQETGEYADRASSLNIDNEDGTSSLGVVKGKTEAGWVTDQLDLLFRLRNKLVDAKAALEKHRGAIQKLIDRMQKRLKTVVTKIRENNEQAKKIRAGMKRMQKHPKANKQHIKVAKRQLATLEGRNSDLDRERDAIKDKILPALTGKRKQFTSFINENIMGSEGLPQIQGTGSPLERLKVLPPIGVLGGEIFDAQIRLRELAAKPSATDGSSTEPSESAELLKELLRQANLRTAVSQKQYDVFKNFPAYGGEFATGGVVPGPIGAARTIIAHGGETITPPSAGGANVQINFGPGMDWLEKFIEVKVDGVTRKQARGAARSLPGRGGGF